MSGNATRLGVGVEQGWMHALRPAGLIGLFVAGVVIGTLTGHLHRVSSAETGVAAAAVCRR